MATTLTGLVARLTAEAPARNSIPADYSQIIKDAVEQVALDAPILRNGSLSIVAQTASYTLPDDFGGLVDLPPIAPVTAPGYLYPGSGWTGVTANGLIPIPQGYRETYDIVGNQIVFTPTPGYSATRPYKYQALYLLTGDTYLTLFGPAMSAAVVYGRFLVFLAQAGAQAHSGWSYSIGNESVSKTNLSKAIADQASRFEDRYNTLINRISNNYGSRSDYDSGDLAWLGSNSIWP